MPLGLKITPEVSQVIAEETLKNLGLQRKEIARLIEARLKKAGLTIPADSTLKKKISEFRTIGDDDRPWHFSVADDKIQYQPLGTLLRLQRWCLIMGSPLTIREAKWASWLANAIDDSKYLLEIAWRYSIRERIKSTYDDPDGELCFPRHSPTDETIRRASAKAGILYYTTREDFTGYEEPLPDFERKSPTWIERSMHIPIDFAMETKVFGEEISIKHAETLSDKLAELYALWLRIFTQSLGWNTLNTDEKISLAQRLQNEIAKYAGVDEGKRSRNWVPSQELISGLGLDKKR
jgi:hypothetical protein